MVTARAESKRLPGKACSLIGQSPAVGVVIQRAKSFGLEHLVLATGVSDINSDIAQIAVANDIQCFRGSTGNKLLRWRDCARQFGFDAITVLEGDDVFFDPQQSLASMTKLRSSNVDAVLPHKRSEAGSGEVGMSITLDMLDQIVESDDFNEYDIEVDYLPWPDLLRRNNASFEYSDCPFANHLQVRVTLDYPEDLPLLNSISDKLGNLAKRADIEDYLSENTDWFDEMTALNNRFRANRNEAI